MPALEDQESVWLRPDRVAHALLLLDSYARLLGRDLVSRSGSDRDQAARLFEAEFVVVSHGVEPDPMLNYGNRVALALWEMDFATLVRTPSRFTAEPVHRDERSRLLARTRAHGFVDDYSGIRISSTGKRFRIDRATVWNLVDAAGIHRGQGATFASWTRLGPGPAGG